jgi:hypothetical protein
MLGRANQHHTALHAFARSVKTKRSDANLKALPMHHSNLPVPVPLQDCFDLEDARRSYFQQLFPLNPSGIVPGGPTAADLGLDVAAGRGSVAVADVFHFK